MAEQNSLNRWSGVCSSSTLKSWIQVCSIKMDCNVQRHTIDNLLHSASSSSGCWGCTLRVWLSWLSTSSRCNQLFPIRSKGVSYASITSRRLSWSSILRRLSSRAIIMNLICRIFQSYWAIVTTRWRVRGFTTGAALGPLGRARCQFFVELLLITDINTQADWLSTTDNKLADENIEFDFSCLVHDYPQLQECWRLQPLDFLLSKMHSFLLE